MESFEHAIVQGTHAISRPVALALHLCFGLTYATHLYRHRLEWAHGKWALNCFLFPLQGGHRHAVFQVFAWGLWGLSAAISVPIYVSLLAESEIGIREDASWFNVRSFMSMLGLRRPLIPLTHIDVASGAAAVSSLWGELFLLKALLVFDGSARLVQRGRGGKAPCKDLRADCRGGEKPTAAATATPGGKQNQASGVWNREQRHQQPHRKQHQQQATGCPPPGQPAGVPDGRRAVAHRLCAAAGAGAHAGHGVTRAVLLPGAVVRCHRRQQHARTGRPPEVLRGSSQQRGRGGAAGGR
ncbi:hypothetical protein Agub_g14115, partial [Astrephomene gubernaculifera]